ncbi:MAG: response regulator [Spirochaetia bacterium]|nr:response regulator [Spirochaetia bacterium]
MWVLCSIWVPVLLALELAFKHSGLLMTVLPIIVVVVRFGWASAIPFALLAAPIDFWICFQNRGQPLSDSLTLACISLFAKGSMGALIGFVTGLYKKDLSDLRAAEKRLAHALEEQKAMLDVAPVLLFHLDRNFRILNVMGRTEHIVLPAGDYVGKTLDQSLPADVVGLVRHHGREALATGQVQSFMYDLTVRDRQLYFKASLVPTSARELVAASQEITDMVLLHREVIDQNVRAQKAVKAQTEFLHNMSHEIRTPLHNILGLAEQLSPEGLERKYVDSIIFSGNTLLHLLNDVLDLARLDSALTNLDDEDFNLHLTLEGFAESMRMACLRKDLFLELDLSPNVPEMVRGDRFRLIQILNNLVGNSIKFTEHGGIRIVVDSRNNRLHFNIIDSGPGVPPEKQALIFEPFTQADSSTTRRFGGTGLGLTITRKVIELMDGEIGLESPSTVRITDAPGVDFWFTIPFQPSERPVVVEEGIPSVRGRVLVADDNEVNRLVIERILENAGMQADVVCDGLAALDMAQNNSYDIILLDVQMPGMDGYEVTEKLRARLVRQVPIVAVTASAVQQELDRCIQSGMDGYITKPFTRKHLVIEIARYLENASRVP